jgi:hypothetical protein
MLSETLKPVLFVFVAIYVAVDELFSLVTQPIAAWLERRNFLRRVRRWITSLPPYAALALFAIPLVVLEPVKPTAAYLAATGHFALGAALFVGGELLKLVLVERLFQLNRYKLLAIPAFAWCYVRVFAVRKWLVSSAIWRSARRAVQRLEAVARDLVDRLVGSERDEGVTVGNGRLTRTRSRPR